MNGIFKEKNEKTNKYRIRIFSNFCDSNACKNVYERLCQAHLIDNYGEDKEIILTNDDNYTHAIIMNTAMPPLNIPKENVLGIAIEPPQFLNITNQFIEYAKKYIGKYFLGEKMNLPEPFREHYSYMWHNPPLVYSPTKTNRMSIIISMKMGVSGHLYRHELVRRILDTDLPIDIYGFGSGLYSKKNDSRIKGEFKELEPYESYQFHICIENFITNEYISEKLVNALLAGCTPIYSGARNVESFFPGSVISMTNKIEEDIKLITNICREPEKYIKKNDVEIIKEKINLLKNIKTIFSN